MVSQWANFMLEFQEETEAENAADSSNEFFEDDYDEVYDNFEPEFMADGTPILLFETEYLDYIKPCTKAEIRQWYKAYEIKEKYAVGAIEGKFLDLLDNGYVFPDYSNKYFGYILKINYYFKQGKKYFKLYIALGNGNINTVNFCLDDTNNKITRALKRYFKEMFSVDDLKFRLIRLQVENKISCNGKKYTEIQKCCIFDDDFEEELLQLNEQLID